MFTDSYIADFFIGYGLLTISLYAMSPLFARAAFVARVLASYMTMLIITVVSLCASIFLAAIGKSQISQWVAARSLRPAMRLTTGVSFEVDDPKDILGTTRPAVFVGNHQTELDVVMLAAMFPKYCSVTAKASLKKVPLLGQFMSLSGTVFIDRKNSKDAREAMAGAANEIRAKKQSVYIFPEGTRSYTKDPILLPFKKGAFHLAVQAGIPIVPCVVANYSHVLYIKDLIFNSGTVPVKILDPIPTEGLTAADVDELTRRTREIMQEELISLTAKARGQPMAMAVPVAMPEPAHIKASS